MFHSLYQTPFGIALLKASETGIRSLQFNVSDQQSVENLENDHISQAKQELDAYFKGDLTEFSVAVDLSSGTEFYQSVWTQLLTIPYGETRSYKDIAQALGDVNAVRAVGMANGRNPIAIMVPCHRVIGADGSLTGYAYGLDMKKSLLSLEQPLSRALQASLF